MRNLTFRKILAGAILLVIILSIPAVSRASDQSDLLDNLASSLSGQTMNVECVKLPPGILGQTYMITEADGTVHFDDEIDLSPGVCAGMYNLFSHHFTTGYNLGTAVSTLLHESMHVKLLSDNESLVECTAMLNVWPLIKSFKFNKKQTKYIYEGAWLSHFDLGEEYLQTGYGCDDQQIIDLGTTKRVVKVNVHPIRKPK